MSTAWQGHGHNCSASSPTLKTSIPVEHCTVSLPHSLSGRRKIFCLVTGRITTGNSQGYQGQRKVRAGQTLLPEEPSPSFDSEPLHFRLAEGTGEISCVVCWAVAHPHWFRFTVRLASLSLFGADQKALLNKRCQVGAKYCSRLPTWQTVNCEQRRVCTRVGASNQANRQQLRLGVYRRFVVREGVSI